MKVYVISGEPFPNGMAATNRIKCYARAFKEGGLGCEVLITRRTEYYGKPILNSEGKGFYEGVPYRYISEATLRSKNVFIRKLNDFFDRHRTKRYLLHNLKKGDVLFLFTGTTKRNLLYINIARSKGAFCVRDLCELPYATVTETEETIRLRKESTEKQFPLFDGIISISDALFDFAKANTSSTCKHIKVPIMVEYEHYRMEDHSSEAEIPYIFHAGSLLQQKDGILGMIEAFGMAKQQLKVPIKYVLTGSIEASSHPVEIRKLIEQYHLEDSVEFVGYLFRDQVKEYLSRASLVISNRPKSQQDYYGFSTKVGEYLASGTPLITTRWGEAANWLKDGESAYIVEPENTEALANAIVRVFTNPEEAHRIGLAGQELCRRSFDYLNWSKPLVDFLNSL